MSEEEPTELEEITYFLDSMTMIDTNYFSEISKFIQKQAKEIEKYKNVIDNGEFTWKQKYEETFEYVKENYINKDKIKEKIKYYNKLREKAETEKINDMFVNYIDCLEELLEESE